MFSLVQKTRDKMVTFLRRHLFLGRPWTSAQQRGSKDSQRERIVSNYSLPLIRHRLRDEYSSSTCDGQEHFVLLFKGKGTQRVVTDFTGNKRVAQELK